MSGTSTNNESVSSRRIFQSLSQGNSTSQSVWSKGMFSSSNTCLDGCPAVHLCSHQADYVPSNSDPSDVYETSHSYSDDMLPDDAFYNSGGAGSSSICSTQWELNRAGDSTEGHPPPASRSCGHNDWNLNDGHHAKRARVENIIKGMSSCPATLCTDVTRRTEELPSHQEHMQRTGPCSATHDQTEQLESQHQQLERLRTKFQNVDQASEATDGVKEGNHHPCSDSGTSQEALGDSDRDSEIYQGWKRVKMMNYFQSRPAKIKLMADVLKDELSKAVSRSVDYIFKSMPLSLAHEDSVGDASPQSSCKGNNCRLTCYGSAVVRVPDVQTEALSLVVQKPQPEKPDKFIPQSSSRAHLPPEPPVPFGVDFALPEDQPPEKNQTAVRQHALSRAQDRHSEGGQATFNTHWNSVKVRSKVNARSVRRLQNHTLSVGQLLCLPHVKIEPDNLMKTNPYMLNEGLSTNHLKKAKLMFFYTRYPSSLVLKKCFHDVQFTRCITSQLIKWFSNFREFFYIQMEKFARHALMEGVADVRGLTVGRESELFRALNVHYNKANDFQVPDRFLDVAEITLREFYIAISLGKDRDPSWKKAIYKVICKLDSDVPADFQSHHTG
ncbi:prospero homeobox protein 1-like [Betta splendens]|uniref:Prospero homeobox protein 1-like n=1 Tax=Betta splendens TaxID=158456 RepID=A0A6P7LUL7_BETSP|nr:prospero homeobox protein 1-like [Betta splendens]